MRQRTAQYGISRFDPVTGQYVMRSKRKRRSRKVSGLGSLGTFGQAGSLKGMFTGVKGVLVTGGIAAGGAIATQQIFDKVAANWDLAGWKRDVAQMATGIALGILIAKIFKKPKLGAAFAIGPVVAGAMNIFGDVMQKGTAGLGLTAYTPINAFESAYAPMYGAPGLGKTTYQAVEPSPIGVPAPPPAWAYGATV